MTARRESKAEVRLKGLAVSPGVAAARVCLFRSHERTVAQPPAGQKPDAGQEASRFSGALRQVVERLEAIRLRIEREVGASEAEIFLTQQVMAEEKGLRSEVEKLILEHGLTAEGAVVEVLERHEARVAALENPRLRERAGDLGELKRRFLDVLTGTRRVLECETETHCQRGRNRIIVAEELTPGLTSELDTRYVLGFIAEHGGMDSHGAILARAISGPFPA